MNLALSLWVLSPFRTFLFFISCVLNADSGGPLVAVEEGKIIGINTCIRANMEGTSFAVPINKVKAIMYDLADGKHINHGYVGKYCSCHSIDSDTHIVGSLLFFMSNVAHFALPIYAILIQIPMLLALGISMASLTPDLARQNNAGM